MRATEIIRNLLDIIDGIEAGIEFRRHEEYSVFYPTAGDFIEFAGNLAHRVLPNLSTDYRISIAFNLK